MEFVTSAARTASEAGYHLVLWPVSNDATELGVSWSPTGWPTVCC